MTLMVRVSIFVWLWVGQHLFWSLLCSYSWFIVCDSGAFSLWWGVSDCHITCWLYTGLYMWTINILRRVHVYFLIYHRWFFDIFYKAILLKCCSCSSECLPSVLWHCVRCQEEHPASKIKWWSAGIVICLEWGANVYGPADASATLSSLASLKFRLVNLSVADLPRSSGKEAIKWVSLRLSCYSKCNIWYQ